VAVHSYELRLSSETQNFLSNHQPAASKGIRRRTLHCYVDV